MQRTEANEATDPMLRMDPTDPMLRMEPFEPMLRIEFVERTDHSDVP
jgi:hypothetical protein